MLNRRYFLTLSLKFLIVCLFLTTTIYCERYNELHNVVHATNIAETEKKVDIPIIEIAPEEYNRNLSRWDSYGPYFEDNHKIADYGASFLHAYGGKFGQFTYSFNLQGLPDCKKCTIYVRLSSDFPGYSGPADGYSDVTLMLNNKTYSTKQVITDNGSGLPYTWVVDTSDFCIGKNSLSFVVDKNAQYKNGLCIYSKSLIYDLPDQKIKIMKGENSTITSSLQAIPESIKVMVINFDPLLEKKGYIKLHNLLEGWSDPKTLAKNCIKDMEKSSGGKVRFKIEQWIDIDEFPRDIDGFQYNDETYIKTFNSAIATRNDYWDYEGWRKDDFTFDYNYFIDRYNIIDSISKGIIDEIWVFSGPRCGAGMYESQMVGKGAYWCNSPPILKYNCRRFVIMGFNFERDVDCMLENFGHRLESVMTQIFNRWDCHLPLDKLNKWEKFTLIDKIAPGNAGCGYVHFAPNSESDYDWGNRKKVWTDYLYWLNYPSSSEKPVFTNCTAWGSGDMRKHHLWWFNCIPKADGYDQDGYANNWWKYFILSAAEK